VNRIIARTSEGNTNKTNKVNEIQGNISERITRIFLPPSVIDKLRLHFNETWKCFYIFKTLRNSISLFSSMTNNRRVFIFYNYVYVITFLLCVSIMIVMAIFSQVIIVIVNYMDMRTFAHHLIVTLREEISFVE